MQKKFTEEEISEIESQLSFPQGEKGVEMALNMNRGNAGMIEASIAALGIKDGQHILEIGHGNCSHLPQILSSASSLTFTGLEISQTMRNEAERINRDPAIFQNGGSAEFLWYDGKSLPFWEEKFEGVLTVNTLYFWKNPEKMLNEIWRVMKPGGRLVVTFAKKDFMEKLPFVRSKFNLYNNDDFEQIAKSTLFPQLQIIDKTDFAVNKLGEPIERQFSVAILEKQWGH